MALIVERPLFRGRGDWTTDSASHARMIQACRLRESGWSVQGLATLYGVTFEAVEWWIRKRPQGITIRRPGRTMRTIEDKVEEAIALVRMGYWPLRQPSEARVRRARLSMNRSKARKRAGLPPRPVHPVSQVWGSILLPMLENDPTLRATDLMRYLQEHRPEHDWSSKKMFNALRGRVRRWKMPEDREVLQRQIDRDYQQDRRRESQAPRPAKKR